LVTGQNLIRLRGQNVDPVHMNWTHSGAVVRIVGFVWSVAAILAVTGASADVWLACGVAATSLGLAGAFHPDRDLDLRRASTTETTRSTSIEVSDGRSGRDPEDF
jgi:hypothetical protein